VISAFYPNKKIFRRVWIFKIEAVEHAPKIDIVLKSRRVLIAI